MEKNINKMVALGIAIEDKRNCIQMYEELIKKQKENDSANSFSDLEIVDRKYLQKLEQSYKKISEKGNQTIEDTIYRFTKKDVEIVTKSLTRERLAL